jgi:hypothetical protein
MWIIVKLLFHIDQKFGEEQKTTDEDGSFSSAVAAGAP